MTHKVLQSWEMQQHELWRQTKQSTVIHRNGKLERPTAFSTKDQAITVDSFAGRLCEDNNKSYI